MNLGLLLIGALSVVWCLVSGEFSLRQWLTGLLFGALLVLVTGWGREQRIPLGELPRRAVFLIWLFVVLLPYHVVRANFQIAWRLIRPVPAVNPAIVRVPAGDLTESALGVEEQIITLTPGQLVVDYADDAKAIYVHLLDAGEYEKKDEASVTWMYDILQRILT